MNGRQAARAAAKRIEELEYVNANQAADIKDYNACIQDIISGGDVCKWCEDHEECQLEAKGHGGCSEWWLFYRKVGDPVGAETGDDSVHDLPQQQR